MKLCVLVYDRTQRRLLELRRFEPDQYAEADTYRFAAQLRAIEQRLDREIVLFRANSEDALRHTHGSYFLTQSELLDRFERTTKAS